MEVPLPWATWCTVFPPCFSPGETKQDLFTVSFFLSLINVSQACSVSVFFFLSLTESVSVTIVKAINHLFTPPPPRLPCTPSLSSSCSLESRGAGAFRQPTCAYAQSGTKYNRHHHSPDFVFHPCKSANTLWVRWQTWNAFNVLLSCHDSSVSLVGHSLVTTQCK